MKGNWFGLKKHFRRKRVIVLMYHRVASSITDPWQNCVSLENFEKQIAVLTKHFTVIATDQLAQQLSEGHISKDAVCVTLDDGYSDNFVSAFPILEKYNCPATFFIPSQLIQEQQPFWWDELEHMLLHTPSLSASFTCDINGETLLYHLEDKGVLTADQKEKHQQWIWSAPPPTQRCAAYLAIWERLLPLPHQQIQDHMAQLRSKLSSQEANNLPLPMTYEQLQELASHNLMSIGLHTACHAALSSHEYAFQKEELERNKQQLGAMIKPSSTILAYPYGRYNEHTTQIASELAIKAAFTTKTKTITNVSSLHTLGRHQVLNWNEKEFKNYLTALFE